jgi:hypothetical protein
LQRKKVGLTDAKICSNIAMRRQKFGMEWNMHPAKKLEWNAFMPL